MLGNDVVNELPCSICLVRSASSVSTASNHPFRAVLELSDVDQGTCGKEAEADVLAYVPTIRVEKADRADEHHSKTRGELVSNCKGVVAGHVGVR